MGRVRSTVASARDRTGSLGLRHGRRTGMITFSVPDLEEQYFAELTGLLVAEAAGRGLSVVIHQTGGEKAREIAIVNGEGIPATDGLIQVPRSLTVADLTRRTSPGPLVLLGEHIQASPFAHVTIDNRAAGYAATSHLIEQGCTEIAMIGPRDVHRSDAADQRYAGYRDALSERGLDEDATRVVPVAAFTHAEGARGAASLRATGVGVDGIVCSNDSVALGVLSALHAHGLKVPADVAVIGLDGISAGAYAVPPLTSIAPDKRALVRRALDVLERQIDTAPADDQPVEQVTVPFTMVQRASTVRPRRRRRSVARDARAVAT